MPAFRRGQSVSFRGQQGVVDAVDLTPGMVDVSYPNGLVKRHRADALEVVARPNSSRYSRKGRKPRRSRSSRSSGRRFSRAAHRNPFWGEPEATGASLAALRLAEEAMGLPPRGKEEEEVGWEDYKARLATSLARTRRLLATGTKMPSVPRGVPKGEARKVESLVPLKVQIEREKENLERRVAFVEMLHAMGPEELKAMGVEVGPGAKTFAFWSVPMTEASGWKVTPEVRAELEAVAQGYYPGKNRTDEFPSFEEQEAARIKLEESAPRPQTPVLSPADREELTQIAQGRPGLDGAKPTAREVKDAQAVLDANVPTRTTRKSKDGKAKLPASVYYEGQFRSTNTKELQAKIRNLELLRHQLEERLPLLEKQQKTVAAVERQGHQEEILAGGQRFKKTEADILGAYEEAVEEREGRKRRGARAHRLEGKKPRGSPVKRKQQMRVRAAETASAVGLSKEGYETPASFVVLPDPPRFEGRSAGADQELCGNPIDGSMYVLRLSGQPRAVGHLLSRAEVEEYKRQWVYAGNRWPTTVAAMADALSEMMNPTVGDSSKKRTPKSMTKGSWRVALRGREVHPLLDPENPPKKDFYSAADVKLVQEGDLIVTTPKEEQRTFQGREGSPGPERDLRFAKRILAEQVEAAKKSMAFPLEERLRIALQAETTREQQAAQNSILRRTKERLVDYLDQQDTAYEALDTATGEAEQRAAAEAVQRANQALVHAISEEEKYEQKWARSLGVRLAEVTAEIDEIGSLQQQLHDIWEKKVYPWKQHDRKTGGFRVITKKIKGPKTWEQAEQAWSEIRSKLAAKGVRVERTISSSRTRVRRSKPSWVGKGSKTGHGKDVSRGFFDPSMVPPSTHFEQVIYDEDSPDFGKDHWIAFHAWKKVPASIKKLVEDFNPPYDRASAKKYSPFFSWVRLDRPLASKRIVKTLKGVEREIPAVAYRTAPVCINAEQRALIEIAKQLRRPTAEMAGHLRWLYRELTHPDERTREQLGRVGERALGVAAWFGNWAQNASETVARVPKRYEKQVPELKVLRALQKRGSEEMDGLPYRELAAVIVSAPLPFVIRRPGTAAKIVGLRHIEGARGAKTRDVPGQFAPVPFAPGFRRYENLEQRKAELIAEVQTAKKGKKSRQEKELALIRAQLDATFVEQLQGALLASVAREGPVKELARLIVEKQAAGGLFPAPVAPPTPKMPRQPRKGAKAVALKRYENAVKRYIDALLAAPQRKQAAQKRLEAYTRAKGEKRAQIEYEIEALKLFPGRGEPDRRIHIVSRAADAETDREERAAKAMVKDLRHTEYTESLRIALYFIFASLGGQGMIRQLTAAQHTLRILIANGGRVPPPGTMSRRYQIAAADEEEGSAPDPSKALYLQGKKKALLKAEAATLVGHRFQVGSDPVYYTFNPALFQVTQRYWNSHPPWPSSPGSERAQRESALEFDKVDAVGRYGAALSLAYESGLHAADVAEMRSRMEEAIGAEDFLSELEEMVNHVREAPMGAREKKLEAVRRTALGRLSPRKSFGRSPYRYLDLLSEGRAGAHLIQRWEGDADYGWMADLAQNIPVELLTAEAQEIAVEPHAYLSSLRKKAQQALIRSQADADAVESGVRLQGGTRGTAQPIQPLQDRDAPPYKVKRRGSLTPVDSHYPEESALAALQFAPGDASALLALIQQRLKQLHGARHRAERPKTRKPRKKR